MSVIKNSPKLEPNSNQPSGEPDKIQNVEKKLKRSNTQIAPAQSNCECFCPLSLLVFQ